MLNYYYKDSIESFLKKNVEEIIGAITLANKFDSTMLQNKAWEQQILILQKELQPFKGMIFFEFSIPRMGKRVDCLLIIDNVAFIVEFKVGEKEYLAHHIDQVWDYALDLKNFHKPSHNLLLVPVLVATNAKHSNIEIIATTHNDNLTNPILTNALEFQSSIQNVLSFFSDNNPINGEDYVNGSYSPTPTIIEAAISLYNNHSVAEITRSDADATNLTHTTQYISDTIDYAKIQKKKIICFVTGVPGAGKTLVGLKVATEHLDKEKGNTSVFLSGNKPLVDILQEALTRDRVIQEKAKGNRLTKKEAKESVKAFIQIIHHYRDEYLRDQNPPYDHVAIFDEAQRAWTKEQTVKFMKQKKGISEFRYSEPEFLISCLDRHPDWATIICLVGGGQEINTGEAGISEWIDALLNSFPNWEVRISPNLIDSEYNAHTAINKLKSAHAVKFNPHLHLGVSMRSFRTEKMSQFVKELLDLNSNAKSTLSELTQRYPLVLTRNLDKAKRWLREKARGSERYGIVVSSQAYRLKPFAIDVNAPVNPVNWFLDDKDDIRSSYFLEDVATEFQVQGLELDWACITWDGDLRYTQSGWQTFSFSGNKWQNIHKDFRKKYLINAYRVLLTRARQGMVIVVPEGSTEDHTRKPEFYNSTYDYLKSLGITILD